MPGSRSPCADLEIRGAGNILGGEQSGHMAAVGFDLYSRLLADAVEERKALREDRPARVDARKRSSTCRSRRTCPTTTSPRRPRSRAVPASRSGPDRGDLAAFRQELTDRFGPMPQPVIRLVEVAELRLTAEAAGVASMSREDGQFVVRFGEGMSRATAMRLLAGGGLPGVKPSDVTFASNQVRVRLPRDPSRAWGLTQALVARLSSDQPTGG